MIVFPSLCAKMFLSQNIIPLVYKTGPRITVPRFTQTLIIADISGRLCGWASSRPRRLSAAPRSFYFYTPLIDESLTSEERPPVSSHTSQGAEASSIPTPSLKPPRACFLAQISVSLSPQSLTVNSSWCVCDICLSPFQGHGQYS